MAGYYVERRRLGMEMAFLALHIRRFDRPPNLLPALRAILLHHPHRAVPGQNFLQLIPRAWHHKSDATTVPMASILASPAHRWQALPKAGVQRRLDYWDNHLYSYRVLGSGSFHSTC